MHEEENYNEELDLWLAERSEAVRTLAKEFPPNVLYLDTATGLTHYIVGYNENYILMTPISPDQATHEERLEKSQFISAKNLRKSIESSRTSIG